MKTSLWTIREWHDHPDIAAIFQEIHDDKLTGRLMIHLTQGQVQSVELCERTSPDDLAGVPYLVEEISARR